MGIILSRVRKKKSTIETLEKLENDIKELEGRRSYAQRKYKQIAKLLLVYSLGLYILFAVIFYYQFNSIWEGKFLYLVPLAVAPLMLYLINKLISWYYVRLINKNQSRLAEMKQKKKQILEEVMDKETYKVAKQILDKYSTDTLPKPSQHMQVAVADDGLRRRMNTKPPNIAPEYRHPVRSMPVGQHIQPIGSTSIAPRPLQAPSVPMLRLPAPILPQNRSYVDRVFEYLIGDGPNNRYALICSQCSSHNGMALKEEFEYIGYKCCYCFFFNPARKIRPEAPRLEGSLQNAQDIDTDSDSKTSAENSDGEHKTELVNVTDLGEDSNISQIPSGINDEQSDDIDLDKSIDESENVEYELLSNETNKEISPEEDDKNAPKPKVPSESENLIQSEKDGNCDESFQKS